MGGDTVDSMGGEDSRTGRGGRRHSRQQGRRTEMPKEKNSKPKRTVWFVFEILQF